MQFVLQFLTSAWNGARQGPLRVLIGMVLIAFVAFLADQVPELAPYANEVILLILGSFGLDWIGVVVERREAAKLTALTYVERQAIVESTGTTNALIAMSSAQTTMQIQAVPPDQQQGPDVYG